MNAVYLNRPENKRVTLTPTMLMRHPDGKRQRKARIHSRANACRPTVDGAQVLVRSGHDQAGKPRLVVYLRFPES